MLPVLVAGSHTSRLSGVCGNKSQSRRYNQLLAEIDSIQ